MKTLTIRHLTLGSGQPKIAVPLVAKDEAALSTALKNLEHACFDIIEFRADYFVQAGNPEYLIAQAARFPKPRCCLPSGARRKAANILAAKRIISSCSIKPPLQALSTS